MAIPLSKRIEILQRTGKAEEARALTLQSRWYQKGLTYYRPSDDMVIENGRLFVRVEDLSGFTEVPLNKTDPLDTLAGSMRTATVQSVSQPSPRTRCCGK